jgi:competence protein ComEC
MDLRERARLDLPPERSPPQGAVLDLVATVARPRGPEEAGGFDEAAYLRRQGVHVVLRSGSYRVVGQRGGLGGVADRIRRAVSRSLAGVPPGERRSVLAGVVLGEDEGLDDELRDRFRASGLYHLLAVSGQNVAYVVAGMILLAWVLGLPRRAGEVAALVAVAGYVLAVGWQPSVVRAGVAGGLASLAWLASRPRDRWYFLLIGAAVLLAWNPYSLLEPGFQLSFAAVAAIFVLVPRIDRRLEGYPLPPRLATVVSVSAACGLVTAPILWLHFGAIPVYSVLANALAAPVVAPLLGLALAAAALHPLLPEAAAALAWSDGWLAAYLAFCARLVGGLPHAQATSPEAVGLLVGAVAIAALLVLIRGRRLRRSAALAGLVLALVVAWRSGPDERPPPPAGLRLTVLDVGQGDAILLEVAEGAVLIDQGPPEGEVAGQLADLGVERLVALVLTHPQRDHVGGAADVLERVEVDAVLDPGIRASSPDHASALSAARQRDVPVLEARAGQRFRVGRLLLRVLWPDGTPPPGSDPNDHAIVILASYGHVDALLTADAEGNVTVPIRPPPVEILKVAHHGSADPQLQQLLELVRPRFAVVSVGGGNDYGHPAPSTIGALAGFEDLAVYRTDRDGRVTIETDGERIRVAEAA